jgi:hypothetical protein
VSRFLPRAVLAAAAVLLVVATALTLLRDTSRVLGTNGVPPNAFVVSIPAGEQACQGVPPAPPATRAIRMTVGVYGDPRARLRADLADAGRGKPVSAHDGKQELPLSDATHATRVCIANLGAKRVELAGTASAPAGAAMVGTKPAVGVFGFEYLRGTEISWGDRLGDVLTRAGYAKGMGGSATGALLLVLLVLTLGGALVLSWRTLQA